MSRLPLPDEQALPVDYFDGLRARPQRALLRRDGDQAVLTLNDGEVRLRWRDIEWPERTRHGGRTAHLASGGSLYSADGPTWDAWLTTHHVGDNWVVKAQQSWRATLLAVVLLVAVSAGMYRWGLPAATTGVLHLVPLSVDVQIGQAALNSLEGHLIEPSQLPAAQRERIQAAFSVAVARYHAADPSRPPHSRRAIHLHFRASGMGANAFALPDGSVVVTDELVELLKDREDVLLGVMGHEIGHVEARHGMRALVQSSMLGGITALALGDVSGLAASASAVLGHLHYSRHMEREADQTAVVFLQANGMKPSIMVELFTRLQQQDRDPSDRQASSATQDDSALGIALSSHPADEERMAFFRQADEAPPRQTTR